MGQRECLHPAIPGDVELVQGVVRVRLVVPDPRRPERARYGRRARDVVHLVGVLALDLVDDLPALVRVERVALVEEPLVDLRVVDAALVRDPLRVQQYQM